ncbi:MAG: hypothetical protein JNJ90_06155 [Saprospiraceae bacterium]|jgi:hypothetical protein|nr:hypothetical protein [Saprospiraceae bacterium]
MSSDLHFLKNRAAKVRAAGFQIQTFMETFFQHFLNTFSTLFIRSSIFTEAGAKVRAVLKLQTGTSKFFSFFFRLNKANLLFKGQFLFNDKIKS